MHMYIGRNGSISQILSFILCIEIPRGVSVYIGYKSHVLELSIADGRKQLVRRSSLEKISLSQKSIWEVSDFRPLY